MTPPRLFERVRVVTIQPSGYAHSAAFDELVVCLAGGFAALGAQVDTSINQPLVGDGINVLVGAHLIGPGYPLPDNCIVFNVEQIRSGRYAQPTHYLDLLKRFLVLDYSARNIEHIRQRTGNEHVYLCKLGTVPALSRIESTPEQDVDVLFYGVVNDRRKAILDALVAAGVKVKVLTGVYGAERDKWIARSKIVLNLHFYDDHIHEIVRTSFLMANRKAIVSEIADDTEIDDDIREGLVAVTSEAIVETCKQLIGDTARRRDIERRAFDAISRRDQSAILAQLVPSLSKPTPTRINLGSGKAFDPSMLNIDIDPKWRPDIFGDITAHARQIFLTRRFGLVRLENDAFDEIATTDVLEHIPDLVKMMARCLDLLRIGGTMKIGVPYDLSWGAWQDPTHVRAFNERSWLYYTDWHWYLGWTQTRFDATELKMNLSPVGENLRRSGTAADEIFRTPRAVDSMNVVLTKRELTQAERDNALAWQRGEMKTKVKL
jgi:hypothetical protein